MNIAVIGLGLIGGSICKALKTRTDAVVHGLDINENTARGAYSQNAVHKIITEKDLDIIDVCFVCLYPEDTVTFIKYNIDKFKQGAIITDVCGVKDIHNNIDKLVHSKGLFYVGGHPMAGKEKSGFGASSDKIFSGANYILTKTSYTSTRAYVTVSRLINSLGGTIIPSSPEDHDRVIAYTSQLAHIVSSSYIKSPTVQKERGFTGGSFQDMTRVAMLEENMWKELFLLNSENIVNEIDTLIENLTCFRDSLNDNDGLRLLRLLKEGKEIKERHLK